MHGTLLYPHPVQPRLGSSSGRFPRNRKMPLDLRRRISIWKRLLLDELLRRARMRPR